MGTTRDEAAKVQSMIDRFREHEAGKGDITSGGFTVKGTEKEAKAIMALHAKGDFTIEADALFNFSVAALDNAHIGELLTGSLTDFQYQGFVPHRLAPMLLHLHDNTGEPMEVFERDMLLCVSLVLLRGPSVVSSRGLQKLTKDGKKKVEYLKRKYMIEEKVGSGGGMVVTLSRIAACFPTFAAHIMITHSVTRPVTTAQMKREWGIEFPAAMRTSLWFSLVPHDPKYMSVYKAILCYSFSESNVINQKKKEYMSKSKEEKMTDTITYSFAAFNSTMVEEKARVSHMESLKEEGATDKLMAQWAQKFNTEFPTLQQMVDTVFLGEGAAGPSA